MTAWKFPQPLCAPEALWAALQVNIWVGFSQPSWTPGLSASQTPWGRPKRGSGVSAESDRATPCPWSDLLAESTVPLLRCPGHLATGKGLHPARVLLQQEKYSPRVEKCSPTLLSPSWVEQRRPSVMDEWRLGGCESGAPLLRPPGKWAWGTERVPRRHPGNKVKASSLRKF
jgi:hypothetical protein